jgi:hypothetical protein
MDQTPLPSLPPLLTTRAAAAYCGFKTTGAIRKARLEGRLTPVGKRGGRGTWMWSREELDQFLRGGRPATVADDQRVTDAGEDWLLVEGTVASTRELRRWLLGFAPSIEVIDPPQLREEIRTAARRLLERHEAGSQVTAGVTTTS